MLKTQHSRSVCFQEVHGFWTCTRSLFLKLEQGGNILYSLALTPWIKQQAKDAAAATSSLSFFSSVNVTVTNVALWQPDVADAALKPAPLCPFVILCWASCCKKGTKAKDSSRTTMNSPLLQNGLFGIFQISVHPMWFCGLVVISLSWGRYTIKRESLRIIPKNLTGGCQYQNMQRDTGKWTAEEAWKADIRMLVWPLAKLYHYYYYDSILLVYGSSQRLNRIFSDCSTCDHFLSKRELQKGLEKHVRYIWVCLLCEWGINRLT